MPGFNGRGPSGQGPGTGWGRGPCGLGMRRGAGGRRPWGMENYGGRPRWGYGFGAYGSPGPASTGGYAPRLNEAEALRNEEASLRNELEAVQKRLAELESQG